MANAPATIDPLGLPVFGVRFDSLLCGAVTLLLVDCITNEFAVTLIRSILY